MQTPWVGFWFVSLWNFKEAIVSDWSRITWRVVGRCVLGETVGLGVESRLEGLMGFYAKCDGEVASVWLL